MQLQPQQLHDWCITSVAMEISINPEHLQKINNYQQYPWATYVSDIPSCDGTRLVPQAFQLAQTFESSTPTRHFWPRPPPTLTPTHTKARQTVLSTLIHNSPHVQLQQTLGDWITDPSQHWYWHYQPESKILFQKAATGWSQWSQAGTIRTCLKTRSFRPLMQMTHQLPPNTHISMVVRHNNTQAILLTMTRVTLIPPLNTLLDILKTLIKALLTLDTWATEDLVIQDEGANVAAVMIAGTCRAVSDGLYKKGRATSAFTTQGDEPQKRVTACNVVSTMTQDASAYRGELWGIFGILTMTEVICRLYHIMDGSLTLGLDGLSTFLNIQQDDTPSRHAPHYDSKHYQ